MLVVHYPPRHFVLHFNFCIYSSVVRCNSCRNHGNGSMGRWELLSETKIWLGGCVTEDYDDNRGNVTNAS